MTATVEATESSPSQDADLGPRVRAAVLWNGGAALVFRLANIGVTVIVARLLSPHDFGVFAVALTVHAVAMSVAELGVSSCLVRGDRPAAEIAPTVATVSLVTSLVLAVTMAVAAGPVAAALGAREAAAAVRVMAIAVALAGVIAVPSAQLSRDFRQDRIFLASVLAFVPSTALLIALAAHGGGALAFAWSRVAGQLVGAVVLFVSVDVRYLPGFTARVLRPLLRFGLPLAGANLLNFVLLNTDYALIGRWLGPVSLGIYVVAFNVASWATTLLSSMINGVAMPAFARAAGDPPRAQRYLHGATQAVAS
jgi:PST family polysaccharide transporter